MALSMARTGIEFTHFTFQPWYSGDNWSCLADADRYLRPQARQYFWENYESKIRAELQKWQDDGWEPVEPLGPQAIKMRRCEEGRRRIDPGDVLLWFLTLGLALLTYVLVDQPDHYVSYVPVEFRIKMRRVVDSKVAVPGKAVFTS